MSAAQPGADDPRGPGARGSMGPARRDVFDLLRSVQTPAERLALIDQGRARSTLYAFELQKAGKGDVQLSLAAQGSLEPAEKVDVHCTVRSTERGKPAVTTILWAIENGVAVKKGELIAKLDDAALRERLQEHQIAVAEKKGLVLQAAQELDAVKAEGLNSIKAAEAEMKLAEAALKAHATTEVLEKKKAAVKIDQAKLLVELAKSKGGAALEVQIAETNLQLAELDAKRIESDLGLAKLRQEAQVQQAQAAVAHAKNKLELAVTQQHAKRSAAEAMLKLGEDRLRDIQEDLGHCKLVAPLDGIVLYYEPAARRGFPAASVIAVGENVRDGQRLFSIWKPGPMLVRINVPESLIARLHAGQRAFVTIPSAQQALAGKVQSISPVAALDGSPAGERHYPAVIALTELSETLRPAMPAQVGILLEEQKNVLRVPVHAVTQRDGASYCFVKKDDGLHEKKVTTGLTTSTFAEIKSGLEAGEEVVVSIPRTTPAGFSGGTFGGRGPGDR
jgi:multidrug resistance efflux pump